MVEDFEVKLSDFRRNLEVLSEKVRKASEIIAELKRERASLRAEIDFIREENKQARLLISKNEKLEKDKILVQNKIDKILKKIETVGV